jgi:putative glutamine amidotransferase
MPSRSFKPLIGLPADRRELTPHVVHSVSEKYSEAVIDAADAIPFLIPPLGGKLAVAEVVTRLDGLLITGAYSNIEPHHYNGGEAYSGSLSDPARDKTSMALIREALKQRVPVLGICRGLQELNVVMGGSLHQKVHEQPGMNDHREDTSQSLDVQYGPAHSVHLESDGILASFTDQPEVMVNSVHGQGIAQLGEGLAVEARAPDGLIEAVSLQDRSLFGLAVQWHPEYRVMENAFYRAIFNAFAAACRRRAVARLEQAVVEESV